MGVDAGGRNPCGREEKNHIEIAWLNSTIFAQLFNNPLREGKRLATVKIICIGEFWLRSKPIEFSA